MASQVESADETVNHVIVMLREEVARELQAQSEREARRARRRAWLFETAFVACFVLAANVVLHVLGLR